MNDLIFTIVCWGLSSLSVIIGSLLIYGFEYFETKTKIILSVALVLVFGLMFGILAAAIQQVQ
jgi:hypothetical protein